MNSEKILVLAYTHNVILKDNRGVKGYNMMRQFVPQRNSMRKIEKRLE